MSFWIIFLALKDSLWDIIIIHIWPIFPEIWSVTDRIFCHFGPFFAFLYPLTTQKINILKKWKKNPRRYYHFTHVYHKWRQLYDAWFLKYEAWQQNFLSFWTVFCSFTPPNNPKNQNFGKLKKAPGDIIIYTSVPKIMIIYAILFLRYHM